MHDLIIIGAGPAGCAAAIVAAARGLDVLVIDAAERPRVQPGESLTRTALAHLRALDVGGRFAAVPAHPFAAIERGDGADPEADGGAHVDRRLLGAALQAVAQDAGARFARGRRVRDVLRDGECIRGVRTDAQRVPARYCLDAGGARQTLARLLGLAVRRLSPRLYAGYGWMSAPADGLAPAPRFTWTSDGWLWLARVSGKRSAWVRLDRRATRACEVPPEGEPTSPLGCADVTWRRVAAAAGPGFLLAGDAHGVLDPASGDGVERALSDGLDAGHAVIHALERPHAADWTLAAYHHRVARRYGARRSVLQAVCEEHAFFASESTATLGSPR